jgi:hypothetical protein
MADILSDLKNLATEYVQSGGVQVFVKTNYGPELPVYTGTDKTGQPGIADLLGLKAQVIVKNKSGKIIQTYGEPAPTEPLKVAAVLAVVALLGVVIVRGL